MMQEKFQEQTTEASANRSEEATYVYREAQAPKEIARNENGVPLDLLDLTKPYEPLNPAECAWYPGPPPEFPKVVVELETADNRIIKAHWYLVKEKGGERNYQVTVDPNDKETKWNYDVFRDIRNVYDRDTLLRPAPPPGEELLRSAQATENPTDRDELGRATLPPHSEK